ncbi:MAG: AzlC family ABC transporter permease [Acidimicrobiia bacterium]
MDVVGPVARRRIVARALSVALAASPFAVAFGAIASASGLTLAETIGFSTFVFTGSAQFAAVAILADGGAIGAAVSTGLLLNLRSLAFGILLVPDLRGPVWWRALVSQLVIDESTAIATVENDTASRRWGFLVGGVAVFVLWNLSTIVGAVLVPTGGDTIQRYGLDATIPAAFLGLLWPRLADSTQRRVAFAGAAIAIAVTPFTPPGIAIVIAIVAVLAGRRR